MNGTQCEETISSLDLAGEGAKSHIWMALCGVIALADIVILAIYWQIGQ